MKKLILSIIVFVYTMIMSGCSYESGPSLKEIMNSWLGYPVESLIDSWGIPSQEYRVGDITYLTYSSSYTRTHTSMPINTGNSAFDNAYNMTAGIGSKTYTLTCNKTMKIRDGIIIGWTYQGHCGE